MRTCPVAPPKLAPPPSSPPHASLSTPLNPTVLHARYDAKFIYLEPKPEYVIDLFNNGLYR